MAINAEPTQVQSLVLPKNFEISKEIKEVIAAAALGRSIFITSRAGTAEVRDWKNIFKACRNNTKFFFIKVY
jgi:hypothetical protein